jgi:hypothetical protein
VEARLRETLDAVGLADGATLPCLLHLLGQAEAGPSLAASAPETIRARAFDALRESCSG